MLPNETVAEETPAAAPAPSEVPPAMQDLVGRRYLQHAVAQHLAQINYTSAQLIPLGQEVQGEAGQWLRAARNRVDQAANMLVRVSVMLENKNETKVGTTEGESE